MMQKWDFETREYSPYSVPDDWNVSCFEWDMNTAVNCAGCGRPMTFGEGYTSRTIHTASGFGFCVCEECYEAERENDTKKRPPRSGNSETAQG